MTTPLTLGLAHLKPKIWRLGSHSVSEPTQSRGPYSTYFIVGPKLVDFRAVWINLDHENLEAGQLSNRSDFSVDFRSPNFPILKIAVVGHLI